MVIVTGHSYLHMNENVFRRYLRERRNMTYNYTNEENTEFLCYLGVFDNKLDIFAKYYQKDIYKNDSYLIAILSEFCRIRHLKYIISELKVITENGFWDDEPEILETYNAFINLSGFIKKHLKRVSDRKNLDNVLKKNLFCNDINEMIESFL